MFNIIIHCQELEGHNGVLLSLALILSVCIWHAAREIRILVLTDILRRQDCHIKIKINGKETPIVENFKDHILVTLYK